MDEQVENIVISHGKSPSSMTYTVRKRLGYQPIKTITVSSGKIDFKHIVGQILFDSDLAMTTKFYNIRKTVLIEYIRDNGGHIRKTANLVEIIEKVKELSHYNTRIIKIIHCIQTIQKKFKEWYNNPELRLLGPGIPISRCVNEECPFTFESLKDIDSGNIITWRGEDSKIYGCDFMSLFTLLKNTLGGRTIYIDKYEEIMNILGDIIEQQKDTTRRSSRSAKRNMIFNEMKNPFTREKFQPELLQRLLQLANQRELIKTRNTTQQNRRSRIRNRNDEITTHDLIGAGVRVPRHIRRRSRILHSTDDIIIDWDDQLENGSRLTNIRIDLENTDLHTLYSSLVEMLRVEQNLADEIRKLGFYVPDSMFSSVINPIREWVRILKNDIDTNLAIPIMDVHLAGLIHSIRQYIVPFYSRVISNYSNPVFIDALNNTRIPLSNIIHTNTILYGIRSIMRDSGLINSPAETHRTRLINIAKQLTHLILISWSYCIRSLLLEIFIRGQNVNITTGENILTNVDRQTIAILLISALVNTGHLGSDFDWAL